MAELKLCPFCGGEAEEKYIKRHLKYRLFNFRDVTHFVYIRCKTCGCTSRLHETKENAIEAWNIRAVGGNG